jgi:putative ABC transport system ATP-binding protein
MATNSIIEFSRVSFSFSGGTSLFKELNLSIMAEMFYLVQGPSGVGKSTFLRLINRLEEPSAGEIRFKGLPLPSYPPPLLRRSVLYIQQTPTVVDASVRENLLLPFTFKNNRDLSPPDDARLETLLNDFLLEGVNPSDPALTLSVGQLQRLCFIRGLLLSPEVLLLDEPTGALDADSSRVVETMVERSNQEFGLTVLMITHKKYETNRITPIVLEIAEGQVREVS